MKDMLLVRMMTGSKYWIRVLDRQTGDLINDIPSKCHHDGAFVKKHPQHGDYLLESCPKCQRIRAYSINTGQRCTVYKGPEAIIICEGPTGSVLAIRQCGLFQLDWNEDESQEAKVTYRGNVPTQNLDNHFLLFSYIEYHDILICTARNPVNDQDNEILAVKLEGGAVLWRLFGLVNGVIIKPRSITCDPEGNAYICDKATNRILKINSLTGEVLRILVLEEKENKTIISIRWSNTEPNLTVRTDKGISTYFVPK